VSAPAKGRPLAPVPDDAADVQPTPAPPARPRQLTRPKLITATALVTALLGWRFATGHHPGRTMAGHAFWFVVWDVALTGVVLWLVTGFKHRGYRDRLGRRASAARLAGQEYAAQGRDRWTDWRDRPRGPGPSDPDPGGSTWGSKDNPAKADPGPAPSRLRGRPRPPAPSGAAGGRAAVPASWRAACAEIANADGDSGQEVLARIAGAAAGFRATGEALSDLHTHVTVDRGYDERAMPSLAGAEAAAGEVASILNTALREVAEFYDHLLEAADEGKRGPHDGHEFEE
jgi:hypothetical protein